MEGSGSRKGEDSMYFLLILLSTLICVSLPFLTCFLLFYYFVFIPLPSVSPPLFCLFPSSPPYPHLSTPFITPIQDLQSPGSHATTQFHTPIDLASGTNTAPSIVSACASAHPITKSSDGITAIFPQNFCPAKIFLHFTQSFQFRPSTANDVFGIIARSALYFTVVFALRLSFPCAIIYKASL